MYVCVHVLTYACVYDCTCVCIHIERPEDKLSCCAQKSCVFFLDSLLKLSLSSPKYKRLARDPQGSSCLRPPIAGIASTSEQVGLFHMGSGDQA